MKLIILYGPPGVGKHTVGKILARRTGYAFIHNHLTIDLVSPLFPFGGEPFSRYRRLIYRLLLQAAVDERLPGMIMTVVYVHPSDVAIIRKWVRLVQRGGGSVVGVQLLCDRQLLFKRIKQPSRRRYQKIRHAATLRRVLRQSDLETPIPFVKTLTIDNTSLSPQRTAAKIIKQYRLPKKP